MSGSKERCVGRFAPRLCHVSNARVLILSVVDDVRDVFVFKTVVRFGRVANSLYIWI